VVLLAVVFLYPAAGTATWVYRWYDEHATFAAFPDPSRREIAALRCALDGTKVVEQKWIAHGFDSNIEGDRFLAPVGPQPCLQAADALSDNHRNSAQDAFHALQEPDVETRIRRLATIADADPSNHLVGLLLGRELAVHHSYRRAESAIKATLSSSPSAMGILESARDPRTTVDLNNQSLAIVVHLYHTLGLAQLSTSGSSPPWVALKKVIASVLPLSRRTVLGPGGRGVTAEAKLAFPIPGCERASSDDELSSYDLFNNLIVAYMEGGYVNPDQRAKVKEFDREPKVYSSAIRELFQGQLARESASSWPHESRLWALSNADRVLDFGVPDDGRIALNIIGVIDWWSDPAQCPDDLCTNELRARLSGQRMELLQAAVRGRRVAPDQRQRFAATVVGMIVRSGVDRRAIRPQMKKLSEWLPTEEASVADDLLASEDGRNAFPRWITSATPDRTPWQGIRRDTDEWRRAALTDFGVDVVAWARQRPASDRERTLVALRRIYGNDKLPARALILTPSSRFRAVMVDVRSSPHAWLALAIAVGLAAWMFLLWIVLHVREYRLLRMSFYEVEREYIDTLAASKEQ
jgi:hypothetical protein